MTPDRKRQVLQLAKDRQPDVKVVLENVTDLHNVGAVMRSCDAVGVPEVHMTYFEGYKKTKMRMGKQTSAGTRKWVDAVLHVSIADCLDDIKHEQQLQQYQILGTALTDDAISMYDVDFTKPTIIIFGNERDGLSKEAHELIDQAIIIPQKGMVQSLNISVACAVTLYEMMRQREVNGMYNSETLSADKLKLLEKYNEGHNRKRPGDVERKDG